MQFTYGVHHAKEEDILFRIIAEVGLDKQDKEIKRLVHQHILSRTLFEEIEENIAEENKKMLIVNFKQYIGMIRGHIKEEDELLFPLLEKMLSEPVKEDIVKQFIEADEKANITKYMKLKEDIESFDSTSA